MRPLYLVQIQGHARCLPRLDSKFEFYPAPHHAFLPPGYRALREGERPLAGDITYWAEFFGRANRGAGWYPITEDDSRKIAMAWNYLGNQEAWTNTSATRGS